MTKFTFKKLYNITISLLVRTKSEIMVIRMQKNRTIQLTNRAKSANAVTSLLALCLLSFLTSGTFLAGGLSPLNVSLAAGVSCVGSIVVLASSLLAYFFNSMAFEALPQICAMICICALKFISAETGKKKMTASGSATMAAVLMLVFGTAMQLIQSGGGAAMILNAAQSLLCGCATFFLIKVCAKIRYERIFPVSGACGVSLGALYVLLISALASIDLIGINFGRIFGMIVILFAAKKYRHVGGAVCGAMTTLGMVLCSQPLGRSTMLLACAGLIAGLFIELGTAPLVISFVAANFVSVVLIGATQDSFNMLMDSAVSTIIFVLIPSSLSIKILQSFETTSFSGDFIANNARQKLDFAAKTVCDVRHALEEVTAAMERKLATNDFVTKVSRKVCEGCQNKLSCWDDNYSVISDAFFKVQAVLEKNGCIGSDEFPPELSACERTELLEKEFNFVHRETVCQKKQEQKLKDMRGMLSEQFLTLEDMLASLSGQMCDYLSVDTVCSRKVATYLEKQGVSRVTVCAYTNNYGGMKIEAYLPCAFRFNAIRLCQEVSELVDRELELPEIHTVDGITRIELWEKPQLLAETGAAQQAGSSKEISGDSYELFSDSSSQSYIVLSDGMGSGKRAQLDSLLASKLVSRLIRAGLGCSSSIRLINSFLRVKNWEESFTTLDIGAINLYNGNFNIIKAGASATYIQRNDKIRKIEVRSMPIGILQEINPVRLTENLQSGDIIITTSDGVPDNSTEMIKSIVQKYGKCSSTEISDRIIDALDETNQAAHRDDITVIVTKIKEYI